MRAVHIFGDDEDRLLICKAKLNAGPPLYFLLPFRNSNIVIGHSIYYRKRINDYNRKASSFKITKKIIFYNKKFIRFNLIPS